MFTRLRERVGDVSADGRASYALAAPMWYRLEREGGQYLAVPVRWIVVTDPGLFALSPVNVRWPVTPL